MKNRASLLILIAAMIFAANEASAAHAASCDSLFEMHPIEKFLRVRTTEVPNEIHNRAAQAALIHQLAGKLQSGSYTVDADGAALGLSVYVDGRKNFIQMQIGSRHLMTTEPTPLMQSEFASVQGARTGLAVRLQLIGEGNFVVTNTIISGNEATYLGLTKREISVTFDLKETKITGFTITENVTTKSVYRKEEVTYTVPGQTVTIRSRR